MPGVRIVSRTDQSGGGFFIRRVASPGAAAEKGAVAPLARRAQSPSNNKENVPPVWAATAAPKRRSSLPEWYPRTPLRDITAVVKAVESKSRIRDAAARQQIEQTEGSPQSVDELQETEQDVPPSTPPPTDETLSAASAQTVPTDETLAAAAAASAQTVPTDETLAAVAAASAQTVPTDETLAAVAAASAQTVPTDETPAAAAAASAQTVATDETLAAAAAASAQTVASTASTGLAEGMLKASDGDYSLQTPSRPSEPAALTDLMEKKLASSIEQIEKMVSQCNAARRDPKAAQPPSKNPAVQRRTLMSMR